MAPLQLSNTIIIQQAIESSEIEIVEICDNLISCTVDARVKTCNDPLVYDNFRVWGPENYNINWTQSDLEQAVIEHYNTI